MQATEVGTPLGAVATPSATADVWFARVGDHLRDVERFSRDFLSADERDRLRRYRSREAAERYVVTRSLVRVVLSDRLGIPPCDLQVSRTDTGKPVVAEGLHFNVSHSGDLILLGVSDARSVGIDVERRRDVRRVQQLIDRWLTDDERDDLSRHVADG